MICPGHIGVGRAVIVDKDFAIFVIGQASKRGQQGAGRISPGRNTDAQARRMRDAIARQRFLTGKVSAGAGGTGRVGILAH